MTRGKNINVYLMDGDVNGRIKCTIANWTGLVYKIPRIEIEKCKDRSELNQSGVYFLFGTSEDTGKSVVYVGQAGTRKSGEGILRRLSEHNINPDKDYWTDVVVFLTQNNSFGATEISYLENQFCKLARDANRYEVKNGNEPTQGNLTEEKESELEEYIDYAKIVMGTLGYKVFLPLTSIKRANGVDCPEDNMYSWSFNSSKSKCKIEARAKETAEGFVVLKGSQIEILDSESIPAAIKERRRDAKNEGIILQEILQEDMLFSSPSYAAAFVCGGHRSGRETWRNIRGETMNEAYNRSVENQ